MSYERENFVFCFVYIRDIRYTIHDTFLSQDLTNANEITFDYVDAWY